MAATKICEIEGDVRISKIKWFSYNEKVHFPGPKFISVCFLYPPNLSQCVKLSLEIFADTEKICFGRLEVIISCKIGSHENRWNREGMWKFQKISKMLIFFLRWKSAFFCLEIHLGIFPIPSKLVSECRAKSGDTYRYPQNNFWTLRSHSRDHWKNPPFATYRTVLSPVQ